MTEYCSCMILFILTGAASNLAYNSNQNWSWSLCTGLSKDRRLEQTRWKRQSQWRHGQLLSCYDEELPLIVIVLQVYKLVMVKLQVEFSPKLVQLDLSLKFGQEWRLIPSQNDKSCYDEELCFIVIVLPVYRLLMVMVTPPPLVQASAFLNNHSMPPLTPTKCLLS